VSNAPSGSSLIDALHSVSGQRVRVAMGWLAFTPTSLSPADWTALMREVSKRRESLASEMLALSEKSKGLPAHIAYLELQRRVARGGCLSLRWRSVRGGFLSRGQFAEMVRHLPVQMAVWSKTADLHAHWFNAQERSLRAMAEAVDSEGEAYWDAAAVPFRADAQSAAVLAASIRLTQRNAFTNASERLKID
jgi:hypothetical protein